MEKFDAVNRPSHYAGQGEVECIDFIEIMIKNYNAIVAGCLFNTIKYIWRAHHKNGKQDLEKALWYANKAEDRIQFYKDTSACFGCSMSASLSLSVEETLIVHKAVKQITDKLPAEEAECFMIIISCIENGGLTNREKDYSPGLIDALKKWIEVYKEN